MKTCIIGVARSGTTAMYALIQKMLLGQKGTKCEFAYEPFLWDRNVFNDRYDKVSKNFYYTDSLSYEGIYHHKSLAMLIDDPANDKANPYLNSVFNPDPPPGHFLAKFIRAAGRVKLLAEISPECRFIYIIRNPVDVLNSVLSRFSFYGVEFHKDDHPRLVGEVNQHFRTDFTASDFPTTLEREFFYWHYMNRFCLESLASINNDALIVCHDNYILSPDAYCEEIERFLGLPTDPMLYKEVKKPVGAVSKSFVFNRSDKDKLSDYLSIYIDLLKEHGIEFNADSEKILDKYRIEESFHYYTEGLSGVSPLYLKSELMRTEPQKTAFKKKIESLTSSNNNLKNKIRKKEDERQSLLKEKKNISSKLKRANQTINQQEKNIQKKEDELTSLQQSFLKEKRGLSHKLERANQTISQQGKKIRKHEIELSQVYNSFSWKFGYGTRNLIAGLFGWIKPLKRSFNRMGANTEAKDQKLAVYDPGYSEYGHHAYFNQHVITVLSTLFKEIVYFDEGYERTNEFNKLPENVRIVQLTKKLKMLKSKSDQGDYYQSLWKFIKKHKCSQILFTSQGEGKNKALWENPPKLPYAIIIHIVWQMIQRSNSIRGIKQVLRNATCLFVLEDYLVPMLARHNKYVFRFPYKCYNNDLILPLRSENHPINIGTIGIINERRNIEFILNALARYDGPIVNYYLCGMPVDDEGKEVVDLYNSLDFRGKVNVHADFRYLSEGEYEDKTASCDFALIAYDESRMGQAPGVLYQFSKCKIPIIAPNIEPFNTINKTYKGIFILYDNLDVQHLNHIIAELALKQDFYHEKLNEYENTVKAFISENSYGVQLKRLESSFGIVNGIKRSDSMTPKGMSQYDPEKQKNSVLYFPVFEDADDMYDHMARASWYLDCMDIESIYIPVYGSVFNTFELPDYMDPCIASAFEKMRKKFIFVDAKDEESFIKVFKRAGIILMWQENGYPSVQWKKRFQENRKNKQIWLVDKERTRFEGSHYIKVGLENYPGLIEQIKENKKKFKTLVASLKGKHKSYVFGTGPMVAQYKNFSYKGCVKIICNSIIFDDEMMETIKPDILVFADPIFHFGVSKYAADFRKKLVESQKVYGFHIVIPFNYYRLFVHHFPDLEEKTIGIPYDFDAPINTDLQDSFYLNPFKNILTILMLPLASTLTNKVYILGSDGRQKQDDSYFWSHNPRTQINDQMDNIKITHPAFFAINYNEYYEEHLADLEEVILEGEVNGVGYHALTPSYVECLRERYKYRYMDYEAAFYPLVSVIVVADLDNVTALQKSIESVLAQQYPKWGLVIVVNSDDSRRPNFLLELIEKDLRVNLYPNNFSSVYDARRYAVNQTNADFVGFLTPGDLYLPGSLSRRMDKIMAEGSDGVFCMTKHLDDNKDKKIKNIGLYKERIENEHFSERDAHLSSLVLNRRILSEKMKWNGTGVTMTDHLFLKEIARSCRSIVKAAGATACRPE